MVKPGGTPSLLERIQEYLEKHEIPPTRFGRLAVGSPSLINRMKSGKSLRRGSIERIEALMAGPPVVMTPKVYRFRRYRVQCSATIRDDLAARNRRADDPCEQAAIVLRRDGWMVCRASVKTEGATGYLVGQMSLTDEEMMAMARKKGWAG